MLDCTLELQVWRPGCYKPLNSLNFVFSQSLYLAELSVQTAAGGWLAVPCTRAVRVIARGGQDMCVCVCEREREREYLLSWLCFPRNTPHTHCPSFCPLVFQDWKSSLWGLAMDLGLPFRKTNTKQETHPLLIPSHKHRPPSSSCFWLLSAAYRWLFYTSRLLFLEIMVLIC